jgi:hypothetical protein
MVAVTMKRVEKAEWGFGVEVGYGSLDSGILRLVQKLWRGGARSGELMIWRGE